MKLFLSKKESQQKYINGIHLLIYEFTYLLKKSNLYLKINFKKNAYLFGGFENFLSYF